MMFEAQGTTKGGLEEPCEIPLTMVLKGVSPGWVASVFRTKPLAIARHEDAYDKWMQEKQKLGTH